MTERDGERALAARFEAVRPELRGVALRMRGSGYPAELRGAGDLAETLERSARGAVPARVALVDGQRLRVPDLVFMEVDR